MLEDEKCRDEVLPSSEEEYEVAYLCKSFKDELHEQGHKDVASVGLGIDAKKIKIVRNKLIKVVINDLKTELYTFLAKRRKLQ